MSKILEVNHLVKRYGSLNAVDGISFSIPKGVCFGLLGPNGAGKTTTVEMMEGITKPTSGEILYCGKPLDRNYKREVGIQFQTTNLQDFLTTKEVLQLFRSFYRKTLPLEKVIEMCSLEEFLQQDNRSLSGGQKQRLYLALALINDPEVLFLDEPTTGLDPQARQNCWQLIRSIKERNKTIILTTHYMEEAANLCDTILIMDRGRIIAEGAPEELLRKHFDSLVLTLPTDALQPEIPLPWKTFKTDRHIEIQTDEITQTIQYLIEKGIPLAGLRIKTPSLEDLFLELTGQDLRR